MMDRPSARRVAGGKIGLHPVFIGFVLQLVLVGCGSVGLGDSPQDVLERNRRLWEEAEPAAYSYEVGRLCFCTPESLGPVRVVVEDGIVIDRTYVGTGDPVDAGWADLFPLVEGLFDILEDAYDRDASDVQVTFDPTSGVPIEFSIDYILNAADDELGMSATVPVPVLPQE